MTTATRAPEQSVDDSRRALRSRLLRRAVALLARRDYSRAEIKTRLLRPGESFSNEVSEADLEPVVAQVLDRLQAQGLLNEERFAREFVRARSARFGPVRLRHELLRRGIDGEAVEALLKNAEQDEFAAAHSLWLKRFKTVPSDPRERARQIRFLTARGFSHDVIRRVLAGE